MIVEYIRYALSAHDPDDLVGAYTAAGGHLKGAPECLAFELSACVDEPRTFILRIEWASAEAHMQQFRRGAHFPPFLALVRPFIDEIVEMRHYRLTDVGWRR